MILRSNLLFAFAFILFTACKSKVENTKNKIFRYNEASGITSLDPAFARAQNNIWAVHQLYNTLVEFDQNMQLKPCLADTFWVENQGLKYVFKLREKIPFHPHAIFKNYPQDAFVNAEDVVYSFKRLQEPSLASPGAWTMDYVDSVYSEKDVVVFKLKQLFPPFLSILSMKYCSIISKKVAQSKSHNYNNLPIGTGPFYLKLWAENEKMVLRKNPFYFEKDSMGNPLPYLDAVNIRFITDKQSAFLEMKNGNFDFLSGLDPSYKDEIINQKGDLNTRYNSDYFLQKSPFLNFEYLAFNLLKLNAENSPYVNIELRMAMNYAIDRAKMLKFLRSDMAYPAHQGVVPPSLYPSDIQIKGYYKSDSLCSYYLEKAGFPKGKGLPELVLNTNASYADIAEYLQNEWNQAGIPVKINIMQASTLRESVSSAKLDFFRASWIADYPNPENYIFLFITKNHAPNGPNYSFFSDPDVDYIYQNALLKDSDSAAYQYALADSIIISKSPVIPLYYDMSVRLVSKKVSGLNSNPMNLLELRKVDIH